MAKNPFVNKSSSLSRGFSSPERQSMGILDDFKTSKVVETRELNATQVNEVRHANQFVSIQAAIDSLPSTGGTVFIDAGTYTITSAITITNSNVTLQGEGKSSVMRIGNSANCNAITLSGQGVRYIVLRDFMIDGNKANNTTGHGIYIDTPDPAVDESYHILDKLFIKDTKENGVYIANTGINEIWLRDVRVESANGHGFLLYSNDLKLNGCLASNCQKCGFYFPDTGQGMIVHCKAYNNNLSNTATYAGFKVWSVGAMHFVNCHAQNNWTDGWYIYENTGTNNRLISLIGCLGESNDLGNTGGKHGLYISRNNVQVIGGEYSEEGTGNQAIGIKIAGASTGCLVTGAEISGNSTSQYTDTSTGTNIIFGCLGHTADTLQDHSLTVANLTDSGLSASQAVMTDANKKLISADYLNQAVKTTSSPTFAEITDSALTSDYVVKATTSGKLTESLWRDDGTSVAIGTTPSAYAQLKTYKAYGAISGASNGATFECYWGPPSNDGTQCVRGAQYLVQKYGTSNATGTIAIRGMQCTTENAGAGNVTEGAGVMTYFANTGAGTTTNYYHSYMYSPAIVSGALTNSYGLYINTQAVGSTVGYGIYQASTSDKNIVAGKTRVGGTTAPTYEMDVTGTVNATTGYRINGTAGASGSFTTTDGKTVTVTNGLITAIV